MCTFCTEHHFGDEWYFNLENFLFNKVYPDPEERARIKKDRIAHMCHQEWHEAHPKYALDEDLVRKSSAHRASQVVTLEDANRILDLAEESIKRQDTMIATARCACAMMRRGKIEYRCIFFGVPTLWSAEIGFQRYPKEGLTEFGGAQWSELRKEIRKEQRAPITAAEAKELFQEWDKQGLVHTVVTRGLFPMIDGFCNCERPICIRMRQRDLFNTSYPLVKGTSVAEINLAQCTRCRNCMEYCPFGAIFISKYSNDAAIDPLKCFGCGLCRVKCKPNAIRMVPRKQIPVAASLM